MNFVTNSMQHTSSLIPRLPPPLNKPKLLPTSHHVTVNRNCRWAGRQAYYCQEGGDGKRGGGASALVPLLSPKANLHACTVIQYDLSPFHVTKFKLLHQPPWFYRDAQDQLYCKYLCISGQLAGIHSFRVASHAYHFLFCFGFYCMQKQVAIDLWIFHC